MTPPQKPEESEFFSSACHGEEEEEEEGHENGDVAEVRMEAVCRGWVTYLPGTFGGGAGDTCVVVACVGGLSLGPLSSSTRLSAGVRD